MTASKLYETSRCKTPDGSLVDMMFGANKIKDTAAMKRGRDLESKVVRHVEETRRLSISNIGLVLQPSLPFFGASPDGMTRDMVVEVKCPSSVTSMETYIKPNGDIGEKFRAQMQLQMHMTGKKTALFCVAHPEFEKNKDVRIVTVSYDEVYIKNVLQAALQFWETAVWPQFEKIIP